MTTEITKIRIKEYTNLWFGDKVKHFISGKEGTIAKFDMQPDGLHLMLKTGGLLKDDGLVSMWSKVITGDVKKYKKLGTIKNSEYDKISELVGVMNDKLTSGDISISKVSRDKTGEIIPDSCVIWYSCSDEDLAPFTQQMKIHDIVCRNSIKKMTKAEIMALPGGVAFAVLYVANDKVGVELVWCVKVMDKTPAEILTWTQNGDMDMHLSKQDVHMVVSDGSFIPSHTSFDEIGYFYIAEEYVTTTTPELLDIKALKKTKLTTKIKMS